MALIKQQVASNTELSSMLQLTWDAELTQPTLSHTSGLSDAVSSSRCPNKMQSQCEFRYQGCHGAATGGWWIHILDSISLSVPGCGRSQCLGSPWKGHASIHHLMSPCLIHSYNPVNKCFNLHVHNVQTAIWQFTCNAILTGKVQHMSIVDPKSTKTSTAVTCLQPLLWLTCNWFKLDEPILPWYHIAKLLANRLLAILSDTDVHFAIMQPEFWWSTY
jgi:hypothetical protein